MVPRDAEASQLHTPHGACDHYFCLHLHPVCVTLSLSFLPVPVENRTVSQVFCMHTAGKREAFFSSSGICPFFKEKGRKRTIEEKTRMRLYFFSALVRRRAIFP